MVFRLNVSDVAGANEPAEDVMLAPMSVISNLKIGPLAIQGTPPLVAMVVLAMGGADVHTYLAFMVPSVSVGKLAHELPLGPLPFQKPLAVTVAPVIFTIAPGMVAFDLHFDAFAVKVNLTPPGLPARVNLGEKVPLPVTLQVTVPEASGFAAQATPALDVMLKVVATSKTATETPRSLRRIVASLSVPIPCQPPVVHTPAPCRPAAQKSSHGT